MTVRYRGNIVAFISYDENALKLLIIFCAFEHWYGFGMMGLFSRILKIMMQVLRKLLIILSMGFRPFWFSSLLKEVKLFVLVFLSPISFITSWAAPI